MEFSVDYVELMAL